MIPDDHQVNKYHHHHDATECNLGQKVSIFDNVLIILCVIGLVTVLTSIGLVVALTVMYSAWFLFAWAGVIFCLLRWSNTKRNGE